MTSYFQNNSKDNNHMFVFDDESEKVIINKNERKLILKSDDEDKKKLMKMSRPLVLQDFTSRIRLFSEGKGKKLLQWNDIKDDLGNENEKKLVMSMFMTGLMSYGALSILRSYSIWEIHRLLSIAIPKKNKNDISNDSDQFTDNDDSCEYMIEEAQKEKEKLEEKLENLYEIATMASEESSIIESEDYEISYEVEQIIQKSLATWFPDIRKAIMTVRSLEKIGEKIIFSLLVKVIEKAVDLNILYSDGEKNSNQSKAFLKALPVNIALMIEKLNSFPQNGIKKLASDIAQQSLKWMTNHASLSCEDYFEMIKDMKPKDKPFAWSFAEKGIFFLSPHAFSSFIDNQRFTYGVIIKEVKWKLNDTTEKLIKTGSYQIVTSNRINMGYLFGPSIGEIQHNRRAEEVNTIIIAVAPNAKVDKQTLLESILLVFPTLIRANSQIQFLSSQTIFSISTHHENELISQFNDTFLRSRESLMMLIRFLHTYSNSSSIFNTKIFLENLLLDSHEKLYIQSYISSCHQ